MTAEVIAAAKNLKIAGPRRCGLRNNVDPRGGFWRGHRMMEHPGPELNAVAELALAAMIYGQEPLHPGTGMEIQGKTSASTLTATSASWSAERRRMLFTIRSSTTIRRGNGRALPCVRLPPLHIPATEQTRVPIG